jgi:hypothetical protein
MARSFLQCTHGDIEKSDMMEDCRSMGYQGFNGRPLREHGWIVVDRYLFRKGILLRGHQKERCGTKRKPFGSGFRLAHHINCICQIIHEGRFKKQGNY